VIAPQGNRAGRERLTIQFQVRVGGREDVTGIGEATQPSRFGRNTIVMANIHGDGLVDVKRKEGGPRRIFVIVGCLNIGQP